jgi:hypothetical protein
MATRIWTISSRWLRVSLRIVTMPRSGRDRDGLISMTSLDPQDVAGTGGDQHGHQDLDDFFSLVARLAADRDHAAVGAGLRYGHLEK